MSKLPSQMELKLLRLKARISRYNAQIRREAKRPLPDWLRMRKLKVAKLKAKDRVARIMRTLQSSSRAPQAE
ncbi:MAG: hypothetical protein ABJI96_16355 [Paracoccaceae bacterium]